MLLLTCLLAYGIPRRWWLALGYWTRRTSHRERSRIMLRSGVAKPVIFTWTGESVVSLERDETDCEKRDQGVVYDWSCRCVRLALVLEY